MCFIVSESFPDPLVAKRDIPCYKAVFPKGAWHAKNGHEAACQDYTYFKNRTTKKVTLRKHFSKFDDNVIINEGYHSFRSVKVGNKEVGVWAGDLILVKMVIPKGTIYYKNDREYVSERIKCIGPLK